MFHEPHPSISRPALLIVISNHIFIVRIRMLRKIPLDKVSSLFVGEAEQYMDPIYVSRIQPNRVPGLNFCVPISNELIRHLWRTSNLSSSSQSKKQEIQHKPIILYNKRSKLESTYKTIRICVTHILI